MATASVPPSNDVSGPVPTLGASLPAPGSKVDGPLRRAWAWLRRHPVVCLLFLTPGIPEYLSSSSSLTLALVNPFAFFAFLALNLGLYGPGVLLIREALVRWRKGWPTLLLLGVAYGILEEGVALATIFNPIHDAVGHFFGVNWIWTPGVLMVHVVYSIGLPIGLLGLALPETRGRSLIGRRGITVAFGLLALDVVVLEAVVVAGLHFWIGLPALIASLTAIGALVVAARWMPKTAWPQRTGAPRLSLTVLAALGAMMFVSALLLPPVAIGFGAPVAAVVVALVGALAVLSGAILWGLGTEENPRHSIALAIGLLTPLALVGVLFALPVPVVLAADVVAVLFFRWLWARYSPLGLAERPPVTPVAV